MTCNVADVTCTQYLSHGSYLAVRKCVCVLYGCLLPCNAVSGKEDLIVGRGSFFSLQKAKMCLFLCTGKGY